MNFIRFELFSCFKSTSRGSGLAKSSNRFWRLFRNTLLNRFFHLKKFCPVDTSWDKRATSMSQIERLSSF